MIDQSVLYEATLMADGSISERYWKQRVDDTTGEPVYVEERRWLRVNFDFDADDAAIDAMMDQAEQTLINEGYPFAPGEKERGAAAAKSLRVMAAADPVIEANRSKKIEQRKIFLAQQAEMEKQADA